jgi:hypothetical protein
MAPVPVVLLGKAGSLAPRARALKLCVTRRAGTPPMWQHWAWFTTGWIAVSSFGIAIVYRVAGTIASGDACWRCHRHGFRGVCNYGCAIVYSSSCCCLQATWACRLLAVSCATGLSVRAPYDAPHSLLLNAPPPTPVLSIWYNNQESRV